MASSFLLSTAVGSAAGAAAGAGLEAVVGVASILAGWAGAIETLSSAYFTSRRRRVDGNESRT